MAGQALSGKTVVAAAGTSEPLGEGPVNGPLMVKALVANSGVIYLGRDEAGEVDSSSGLELLAGEPVVFEWVTHLGNLRVDASVDGEGVTWALLSV